MNVEELKLENEKLRQENAKQRQLEELQQENQKLKREHQVLYGELNETGDTQTHEPKSPSTISQFRKLKPETQLLFVGCFLFVIGLISPVAGGWLIGGGVLLGGLGWMLRQGMISK